MNISRKISRRKLLKLGAELTGKAALLSVVSCTTLEKVERKERKWKWPNRARAAVSLTYDDGRWNNLDQAVPDLNVRGLLGTFYLPTGFKRVRDRKSDWRDIHLHGHEIGSHSVNHPARADGYAPNIPEWLPPKIWLERYSPEDIQREIDEAANWLNENIGDDVHRTYAYPCGSVAIGEEPDEASYDRAIEKHHFAARIGGDQTNDPQTVKLNRIQSYGFSDPSLSSLVDYCNNALSTGGWTVLMFHGVGGPTHITRREIHQELLDFLLSNEIWVAPLRDVALYIKQRRNFSDARNT